jgi:hypothetical protein
MRCPACSQPFVHTFNYHEGTHVEHQCPCGQLLQWDFAEMELGPQGRVRVEPLQLCQHEERKKPGALVPLP